MFNQMINRQADQPTNRPADQPTNRGLFREIQDAVAVVQHQKKGDDEEKEHNEVHDAIAFTAGVLYVIHDGGCCMIRCNVAQK